MRGRHGFNAPLAPSPWAITVPEIKYNSELGHGDRLNLQPWAVHWPISTPVRIRAQVVTVNNS